MIQYQQLLRLVLEEGKFKADRTGTGRMRCLARRRGFPLTDGFPVLTTKKLHLKSIIYELLWFLKGDTNIKYLNEHGVTIWNEWADSEAAWGGFTVRNGATGARRTDAPSTRSTR